MRQYEFNSFSPSWHVNCPQGPPGLMSFYSPWLWFGWNELDGCLDTCTVLVWLWVVSLVGKPKNDCFFQRFARNTLSLRGYRKSGYNRPISKPSIDKMSITTQLEFYGLPRSQKSTFPSGTCHHRTRLILNQANGLGSRKNSLKLQYIAIFINKY